MNFIYLFALSIVLSIILFSSGLAVIGSTHIELIKAFGRRNKLYALLADSMLSIIISMARIRRAWIKMISPPGDE